MNPLISIIIPVYKVEQYLKECIDSIINQTYMNLEIVIIDDGSPDNCPLICDQYAALDKRIKVIHKKNGGLSDARNAGLNIITGDYVTFVDSDDVIHPEMINILYSEIQKNKSDISCVSIQEFSNSYSFMKITSAETKKLSFLNYTNYPYHMCAWGKLFSSKLFEDIKFPLHKLHEDEFTTYKLMDKANFISYNESKVYYYRQRNGSIMQNKNEQFYSDFLEALLEEYLYFYKKTDIRILEYVYLRLCFLYKDYHDFYIQTGRSKSELKAVKNKITSLPKNYFTLIKQISFKIRLLRYSI